MRRAIHALTRSRSQRYDSLDERSDVPSVYSSDDPCGHHAAGWSSCGGLYTPLLALARRGTTPWTSEATSHPYIVVMTLAVIMRSGGHHAAGWSSCGVAVIMRSGGHHAAGWASCDGVVIMRNGGHNA